MKSEASQELASGAGDFRNGSRMSPPLSRSPTNRASPPSIHDHGRHTPPIPEASLKNIDLGGGHVAPHQAIRRRDHLSPSFVLSKQYPIPQVQELTAVDGRGQGASSAWRLALAQLKRFDIEWVISFLLIIFTCSATAIFTRDKGWFLLTAPLVGFPLSNTFASFNIGLSTYVAEAYGGDERLTLYRHVGRISELSPRAGSIAIYLYVCLVFSLLLSVILLWYIALFYQYLKSIELLPSRESAVRLFGLGALTLGLLLSALGTGSFRAVIWNDMRHRRNSSESVNSADASPSFTDIDTGALALRNGYAYGSTVITWLLWIIVGCVFISRSSWWAKGAGMAATQAQADIEIVNDDMASEEENTDQGPPPHV
ncbi:hypothetical protein NSK_007111 [Nannochloropsis salina CCMP1776]|uniref:Uncharacterized protein n=1 Tax=Nannochloropsis salina CCMP1776 TaxID=1027361 RepID=A0A4D9CTH1_9STRA|nr:hypothetical protein NSK_007111 [Nannochloropsis salina CCMP1776]|eukprot:TFJ81864.1 hypothetical protein NSK_007111 [Nannochloropsis salina CCMP1776]